MFTRRGSGNDSTDSEPWKSSNSTRSQARAGLFRNRCETSRVIKLLDVAGSWRQLRQRGRLRSVRHGTVMSALEKKAQRFRSRTDSAAERDKALLAAAFNDARHLDNDSSAVKDNSNFNFNRDKEEIQQLLEEKAEFLEVLGVSQRYGRLFYALTGSGYIRGNLQLLG